MKMWRSKCCAQNFFVSLSFIRARTKTISIEIVKEMQSKFLPFPFIPFIIIYGRQTAIEQKNGKQNMWRTIANAFTLTAVIQSQHYFDSVGFSLLLCLRKQTSIRLKENWKHNFRMRDETPLPPLRVECVHKGKVTNRNIKRRESWFDSQ